MKRSSAIPQTTFAVCREAATPIRRQVYDWLRAGITGNRFRPGAQLPATRALAAELGVARATVVQAYDQLISEGYVTGQSGAGTFVSKVLPDYFLEVGARRRPRDATLGTRQFSRRGLAMTRSKVTFQATDGPIRAFRPGPPAIDAFPWGLWLRLTTRCQRRAPRSILGYPHPAGYRRLRSAIAAYLRIARDVRCEPEQVLIAPSAQLGLDLLARILLDPGDEAWIEDPGYLGARNALRGAGVSLVPIPVDAHGLDVEMGVRHSPAARLAYVTPSHQYPLGVTMSYPRRQALLSWARKASAWIIEDDYDSEFRYVGQPLSSLHGLDDSNRVIYLGTFSKVLFPALRLAYMVVPQDLVDPLTAALEVVGADSPSLSQLVLAEFIEAGHFVRHIRQMRKLYGERQASLIDCSRRELLGLLETQPHDSGMRLLARLPLGQSDVSASHWAASGGIEAPPLSAYCLEARLPPALLLGYAAIPEPDIRIAVQGLAIALRSGKRQAPTV